MENPVQKIVQGKAADSLGARREAGDGTANAQKAAYAGLKIEPSKTQSENTELIAGLVAEIKKIREENRIAIAELSKAKTELAELKGDYEWLLAKYRLKASKVFGRSSEKHMVDGQTAFEGAFDEAEATADPSEPEPVVDPDTSSVTYKKPKRHPGQKDSKLAGLPERVEEFELPEEKRKCAGCGAALPELAPAVSRRVEVIPAQVCVVKSVRHRYAPCARGCAGASEAPMPQPALPHSIATESALAFVITQKYQFGLPLYRQQQQWKMLDVDISRQTMANWVVQASQAWLSVLYGRMRESLLKRDIIMADETELQVLHEPGRPASAKSFMWLYRTSPRDGPPIALFEYRTTRAGKHPRSFLEGFVGFLCTDGYMAYYSIPGAKNVSCWMHARRYFNDAIKSLPAADRGKPCLANEGIAFCADICTLQDRARLARRLAG
jgi:transposase